MSEHSIYLRLTEETMSSLLRSPCNQNISFFQGEFHKIAWIASLFIAMLNKKLIMVFDSWAEICEDDGKTGVVI